MIILIFIAILFTLYLFLIAPRPGNHPDYGPLFGWHYAHRGFHDNKTDAPENSLSAIRKAVENGYGIEFDIQLTKDKIPVVFHDDTLKRICGQPGHIWDYTFQELQEFTLCDSQERIPLLKDVLAAVDGKVPLIIEYKMHNTNLEICKAADPLLQTYHGTYCIESFLPHVPAWYKKVHPHIVRGQLSCDFSTPEKGESLVQLAVHYLLTNVLCRPDFIAYSCKSPHNLSRTLCRKLFRAPAVAWTIKSEHELQNSYKHFDLFIFEGFTPKLPPKQNASE